MVAVLLSKKAISVLLSVVLVLSSVPSLAYADVDSSLQDEAASSEISNEQGQGVTNAPNEGEMSDTKNDADEDSSVLEDSNQALSREGAPNSSNANSDADQENGLSNSDESNDQANSWRYVDGEQIYSYEGASTEAVDPSTPVPFAAAPGASSYATWYKSNGTTSYTYKANPGDSGQNVAISGVKRVGIDVSYHQGVIDWAKVKNSGVSFAIIRCGYGSDFTSQDDTQFLNNVRGAQANGIDIGIYLYSYALNVTGSDSSAESEARHVLRLLTQAGLEPEDLAYPVYYDLEEGSQTSLGSEKLGQMAKTFCDAISNAGYDVGIYANQNWWKNYLTDSVFANSGWNKWVARYPGTNKATDSGVPGTEIWQFSDCGSVDGINGNCDMNFDYAYSPLVWDSKGLRYLNADGTYFSDGWKTVAGKKYYFGSDGYAYQYEHWIDGEFYYFDGDRSAHSGWLTWWGTDSRSYFDPETGAAYRYEHWIDGEFYYFKASDKCEIYTGWLTWWGTDSRSYFDPETGAAYRYEHWIDGELYYFKGDGKCETHTGWLTWWGTDARSYFGEDGAALTGLREVDGELYYFDPDA
ncbi:MAG: GH25 family lysozyme, partial [Eggerthellaceae bacterium]